MVGPVPAPATDWLEIDELGQEIEAPLAEPARSADDGGLAPLALEDVELALDL